MKSRRTGGRPLSEANEAPSIKVLAATALVSAATLGFEFGLTRVFAALLTYHFAFLLLSIALCGLGLGGYIAHTNKVVVSLGRTADYLCITVILAITLILFYVFATSPQAFIIAGLIALVPFVFSGMFLSSVLSTYRQGAAYLYACDLGGGAIGLGVAFLVLQDIGAINACLFMAAMASIAGSILGRGPQKPDSHTFRDGKNPASLVRRQLIFPLVCFAIIPFNIITRAIDIRPNPPQEDSQGDSVADRDITQDLFVELGSTGHTSRIIATDWDAFARTDLVSDPASPDTYTLFTNGSVPSEMFQWDGHISTIPRVLDSKDAYDLVKFTCAHSLAGPGQHRVFSIGCGGGLDVLMALRFGVQEVDAAEVNPSTIRMMRSYSTFNGHLYDLPSVNVVNCDGRTFAHQMVIRHKSYSLLCSLLTKSSTGTQAGTLTESYVYTQEAFRDYWDMLTAEGTLAVVTDNSDILARTYSTAIAMMRTLGIPESVASKHIIMFGVRDSVAGPYRYAFWLSKTALSAQSASELMNNISSGGFVPIWVPGLTRRTDFGPYPLVASGSMSAEQFVEWWRVPRNIQLVGDTEPIDMSPTSDDRPFFMDPDVGMNEQLAGLEIVLGLLLVSFLIARRLRAHRCASKYPKVSYGFFALLGIGYMLVQVPLLQRLTLPLGHPTLATMVVLYALLAGGAVGSALSGKLLRTALHTKLACALLLISICICGTSHAISFLGSHLILRPFFLRSLFAFVSLFPLGVLMGIPFPTAIRTMLNEADTKDVAVCFAVCGISSVMGAVGAVLLAKSAGFGQTLNAGALTYTAAAGMVALSRLRIEKK